MVAYKKLRGENRRLKAIKKWKQHNLVFDKNELLESNYLYVKFRVAPWSRLSLTNSAYPEPNDQFRDAIIDAFSDIYDLWKQELEKLNKEYYLKIWIMFPNFRNSQIVCAINDKIDWYQGVFAEGEGLSFPSGKFSEQANHLLSNYEWEHYADIDLLDEDYVGNEKDYVSIEDYKEAQKWFNQFLKSEHQTINIEDKMYHILKINDVWVGNKK
ncbi:TPA: hypothetical protein ACU21S_002273 [Mannheimia haemolytica]